MHLLELFIDLSLALLLIVTISYCWVLNARIRVLQDGRGELARLLAHFDESTRRASDSIAMLQSTGKKVGEAVQAKIDLATKSMDDLDFLSDRAEKIADQLEAGINIGRTARRVQHEMVPPPVENPPPAKAGSRISPEDENVVRSAVKAALLERERHGDVAVMEAPEPEPVRSSIGSLQAMIEKIAGRTASDPALRGQRAAKFPETRARSRVEQELLDIIRAGKG